MKPACRFVKARDTHWSSIECGTTRKASPLKVGFRKSFSVGPAERKPLALSTWRLSPPKAGSIDAIVVEFRNPLDRALLERELEVIDSSGSPVVGSIQVDRDEMRWRLTPRVAQKLGTYRLQVGTKSMNWRKKSGSDR
jgi:hypothetical protein